MEELEPSEAIEPVYVDDEDPEVRADGPWKIETVTSLDWAMSRIAALQVELADLADQERARIEAIEERAAALAQKANRGISFFEAMVSEYAHRNRAPLLGGGTRKSRDVLHGSIGWKSKPGKIVVRDAKALGEWLERQSPDSGLYRIKLEPEMVALKALHAKEKTIPPGCEWIEDEDEFFVTAQSLDIVKGE